MANAEYASFRPIYRRVLCHDLKNVHLVRQRSESIFVSFLQLLRYFFNMKGPIIVGGIGCMGKVVK
jgi:hypothetical protein